METFKDFFCMTFPYQIMQIGNVQAVHPELLMINETDLE